MLRNKERTSAEKSDRSERKPAPQKDMVRKPVSAWEISQRPAPAMQEQEVRRPEPGPGHTGLRRPGFLRN